MFRTIRIIAVSGLLLTLMAGNAMAAGGSSATTSPEPTPPRDPIAEADEHYNSGLLLRDRAWKLEKEAAAASDEQRTKLETKIQKSFKRAIREFQSATRKNPEHFQAFSSLGYALRRTGQWKDAIAAYNQSLSLEPNYVEAIEYRAEAYLGLNRVEEAKEAYVKLFGMDRKRADELMEAMKAWIETRRREPGDVDSATVEDFASWVSERAALAGQTPTVSELKQRKW